MLVFIGITVVSILLTLVLGPFIGFGIFVLSLFGWWLSTVLHEIFKRILEVNILKKVVFGILACFFWFGVYVTIDGGSPWYLIGICLLVAIGLTAALFEENA